MQRLGGADTGVVFGDLAELGGFEDGARSRLIEGLTAGIRNLGEDAADFGLVPETKPG